MEKDNKFQITMPELQQIIKEEYASMKAEAERAKEINERIDEINEELGTQPETLSEVEASGTKKVSSTGWTGPDKGDVKYGEKFEKKGTHLKEDDEIEGELEMGGEEEMESPEMGYFEMKLAELGKELDAKIGDAGMDDGMDEGAYEEGAAMEETVNEMEETKHEALEGPRVNPEALSEEAVEEGAEVVAEEVVEEVVEEAEVVNEEEVNEEVVEEAAEVVNEEEVNEEEVNEEAVEEGAEVVNEDLNEPIEGESPSQDSEARFNDYMDKDKHVKEGVQKGTSLLSEGFTPERKSALDSELERMKKLAKL